MLKKYKINNSLQYYPTDLCLYPYLQISSSISTSSHRKILTNIRFFNFTDIHLHRSQVELSIVRFQEGVVEVDHDFLLFRFVFQSRSVEGGCVNWYCTEDDAVEVTEALLHGQLVFWLFWLFLLLFDFLLALYLSSVGLNTFFFLDLDLAFAWLEGNDAHTLVILAFCVEGFFVVFEIVFIRIAIESFWVRETY